MKANTKKLRQFSENKLIQVMGEDAFKKMVEQYDLLPRAKMVFKPNDLQLKAFKDLQSKKITEVEYMKKLGFPNIWKAKYHFGKVGFYLAGL